MPKETVIIAPHADDEIIGCFSVINDPDIRAHILFTEDIDKQRQDEVEKIRNFIDIKSYLFVSSIPQVFLNKDTTLYFPDPVYEIHPAHRKQGAVGESLARQGLKVIFYSTNMNAPYIREVEDPNMKKEMLNSIYPSQMDLWKYDHKYFLFEGFCQWLF